MSSGRAAGLTLRMTPAPQTVVLSVRAPLRRGDLPGLYARACALLAAGRPCHVCCDVAGVAPDAVAVDALARLRLAARRHGCEVTLTGASAELVDLIALTGLSDVLPGPD